MWVRKNGSSSGGAVTVAPPEVICPWQLVVSGNGDPLGGGLVVQSTGRRPLVT